MDAPHEHAEHHESEHRLLHDHCEHCHHDRRYLVTVDKRALGFLVGACLSLAMLMAFFAGLAIASGGSRYGGPVGCYYPSTCAMRAPLPVTPGGPIQPMMPGVGAGTVNGAIN